MLDDTSPRTETYDMVVIGAGIAGLNALYAATSYLPKGARVLLLDEKPGAGGMWHTAYDYVRLHQPHPMFTVGNIRWNWRKPRHYLAGRNEVRDHLASALSPIAKRVNLETRFEHHATCTEVDTPTGPLAEVTFRPIGSDDVTTIHAKFAIHAAGLNYKKAAPLDLSSTTVRSIIPQDLSKALADDRDAPVIVVGGGKTGMDTILATLEEQPSRPITLIKGRGTNFLSRDKFMPTGLKRWTTGNLTSQLFRENALLFDGDNETAVMAHLRKSHSTDPEAPNELNLFGIQSMDEHRRIQEGLTAAYRDYLDDVIDTPVGPAIALRKGGQVPIPEGSIVVNCGGSFFRTPELTGEKRCFSRQRTILYMTARDAFHVLTSVAGFFMIHMHFRDMLCGRGVYTMDHESLFRQDRVAWFGAAAAQGHLNQLQALEALPMSVLNQCHLDFDRWYPLPQRIAAAIKLKTNAKADIAHCQKVLDRVAQRFDIRCAPLE